jgi:hypothetical protein
VVLLVRESEVSPGTLEFLLDLFEHQLEDLQSLFRGLWVDVLLILDGANRLVERVRAAQ